MNARDDLPSGGSLPTGNLVCEGHLFGDLDMPRVVRLRIIVRGAVQGVGFRPFVYRLATELGLAGWVNNSAQGVSLEVEGARPLLAQFFLRLEAEKPPRSFVQSLESVWLDSAGYREFEIRASSGTGDKSALVLPDIATCADCLRELFEPGNRRYRYPFTNCTHCGPRFTIIESLPYDRANTSMKCFAMCGLCQAEYNDPRDRRFHAQPNACPECGPHLELRDPAGGLLESHDRALIAAAQAICAGRIVAVKGLGGFQFVVAAANEDAVRRLRKRKGREEKPLALMFPSLGSLRRHCPVDTFEERLLRSPESPIVLLRKKAPQREAGGDPLPSRDERIAASVAPGNPWLGAMLPYTPLHHLLMAELGFPVVATSGNLSDEPICTDDCEAVNRLGRVADLFLVHNRPIVRHVDDSIVRVMLDRELLLRRARGYAPLPIRIPGSRDQTDAARPILAVGGHLKNTVALSIGPQVFISQHIGDLETVPAFEAFQRVIGDFERLFGARPGTVAADAHPDYLSTRFAREMDAPVFTVQHHYAHVLACMAENELEPPVLGVSWDGTGLGTDGTIWGGEFLLVTDGGFERAGYFRPFGLPGGDAAVREPRRAALGLLFELFGAAVFSRTALRPLKQFDSPELAVLKRMLVRRLNSPLTSSAGRLFDAVASLTGLRQQSSFEGQAAMDLDFARADFECSRSYPFEIRPATTGDVPGALVFDWAPMILELISDLDRETPVPEVAAKFHNTLAEVVVGMARRAGQERVVITGGCFQNKYLTEQSVRRLERAGFRPYWHQRIPPNDGGIALGQVVAAWRAKR